MEYLDAGKTLDQTLDMVKEIIATEKPETRTIRQSILFVMDHSKRGPEFGRVYFKYENEKSKQEILKNKKAEKEEDSFMKN